MSLWTTLVKHRCLAASGLDNQVNSLNYIHGFIRFNYLFVNEKHALE